MLIFPERYKNAFLRERLGRDWVCPLCTSQSSFDEDDIGWVECPITRNCPRTICLGCCLDIGGACYSEEFDSHPYADIVMEAANECERTIIEARVICLRHQHEIIKNYIREHDEPRYHLAKKHIEALLAELEK